MINKENIHQKDFIYTFIHSDSAFTLVEVLVAVVIFAIGIIGVTRMQLEGIKGNSQSLKISEAVNLAEDYSEYLRALKVDSKSNPVVWPDDLSTRHHTGTNITIQGCTYTASWDVYQLQGLSSGVMEREVVVHVAWEDKESHSVTVNFVRGSVF